MADSALSAAPEAAARERGVPIPFLQPSEEAQAPAGPALSPAEVERRAKELAAEQDRKIAARQPEVPRFPPVRGEVRAPVVAGGTTLPFYSTLVDPARVTGARHRENKEIRPRTTECVACEYRKLETRLGDPASLGLDRGSLTAGQLQHFGPGEREYNLCQVCHDANGTLHPVLFERLAAERMKEDRQRTFRHDPAFADLADRMAAVESWRRGIGGVEDLGGAVRESQSLDDARTAVLEDDGEYDGRSLDDRVVRLSEFTGQTPGNPDPLFSNHDAHYDPARIGADEAAAYLMNEEWTARRKENFRRAWAATDEIENSAVRQQVRARLVERWDPRAMLVGDGQMEERASPFAEARKILTPYARSASHSGVDEGFASEPEWKKSALARHEAAVERFLGNVRGKLAKQGIPAERIREITALPELNPSREIVKFRHESPLHQRIREGRGPTGPMEEWTTPAGRTVSGRVVLPTKEELNAAVEEGELRRSVRDAVNHIGNLEAARGSVNAETFLLMAQRIQQSQELEERVRQALEQQDHVQRWSSALQRTDTDLRGAIASFAQEVRTAFRQPDAFVGAFSQLSEDQMRHALSELRERPGDFARTFATAYGKQFGDAGELAIPPERKSAVSGIERTGVLTAEAGERYLEATRARNITAANAARDLGLPVGTSPNAVFDECSARLAAAARGRSEAIREQKSLGPVPTPGQLAQAFTALTQEDRRIVRKELPGVTKLMEPPRREIARTGLSL
jgi:hypothetical protein